MAPPGGCRHLWALLAVAAVAEAKRHIDRGSQAAARAGELRIVPQLSPNSDKLFFGHDYPDDFSPTAPLESDFDHPYPVIQESDKFDRDFVKDENSDRGEWQAQMEYDRLRTQMRKLDEQERKTLRRKEELERKINATSAREREVREEQKRLREHAGEGADHGEDGGKHGVEDHSETESEAKGGEGTGPAHGSSGEGGHDPAVDVPAAVKEVEKEIKDIEECKRRLAEADARLKALREKLEEAKRNESEAVDGERAAERSESASETREASVERERKVAEIEHEGALRTYRKERSELEDLEGRLERAQARVLKLRHPGADQNGGVLKAWAQRGSSPAGAVLLCVGAAMAASLRAAP